MIIFALLRDFIPFLSLGNEDFSARECQGGSSWSLSHTEGTEPRQNGTIGTSSSNSKVPVTEKHLWATQFVHFAVLDIHCFSF